MAETLIMKKLTIGGSTYTIPEYNLPIASASTLGGVKIGTGLSINSTTGVLSATGLDFDEADPVFVASPAYGITQNDIDRWNAKVSDTGKWNGVTLNKQASSPTWNIYLPFVGGTNNENAYYATASTTPTANYISKYDANSYLYSTTPSENDNSTKVATTAYVDGAISTKIAGVLSYKGTKATVADVAAITDKSIGDVWHVTADGSEWAYDGDAWQELGTAIDLSGYALSSAIPTKVSQLTNDSGFITSDSDEKLKTTSAKSSNTMYYPIFGAADSTASTKLYSSNFRVKNYNSVLELQLGQKSSNPTRGKLTIVSNQPNSYGYLITSATADRTYTLPDKTGTIALTSDIPTITTEGDDQLCFTDGDNTFYVPKIDFDTNTILASVLPASGVTAGTYDGGSVKSTGFYIPSFTVDASGRITSATDLGNLIPDITSSQATASDKLGLLSPYSWSMGLRTYTTGGYTLAAGDTSKTITIAYDYYSGYPYRTYFRVVDIQAYDASTFEPVIVDWTIDKIYSAGSNITLTISIASAYAHSICIFPILTYATAGM